MDNLQDFFNKEFTYAVIGASNNPEKYGFKIVESLQKAGFKVIPINPKEEEILGIKAYSSLVEVKETIDVVDFVVPAHITLKTLEEVKQLGISKVWFQPNSFDENCEKFCKRNTISYLKDFCLLKSTLHVLGK